MTPQDISPVTQLMDLTSEPPVPANLRFIFRGLIWPFPEALQAQLDKAAQADPALRDDTMAWIGRVLKPDWMAPDLRDRWRAARTIVSGQDAFLARYALNNNQIQIVVTRFHVHILVLPPGAVAPEAALHEYLKVDRPDDPSPWTGDPWESAQVAGLTYGYQVRSSFNDWRESTYYLTNSRAVKFSIEKLVEQKPGSGPVKTGFAPSEEEERHWFDAKP